MTTFKDKLSNMCGLLVLLSGTIVMAIQSGQVTFLPTWASPVFVLVGLISATVIGWLTGKPIDFMTKK